ncbi:unnamed protein product [Spirodela intermedia]|uniref:DUF6737 domain-containing protein n=1 Tax=Spirodela intermedia TaxID=51605 RepID=A0A7I8L278_SPIIN|nr:unnamed protein product [Spirodela intermedia]
MAAVGFFPLCQSLVPSAFRSLPRLDLRRNRLLDRRSSSTFASQITSPCPSRGYFVRVGTGKGGEPAGDESQFLDEEGVVNDMDGYLNYLSLEYDSIWDTKPSWCQPWTILLTGALAIGCSWVFVHSLILTAVVSSLICAWWFVFLYSYPKAYADMITQRRKNVVSGVEDTFGITKNQ